MIDVVVIISIHFVYNCTYVQSSGHLSCAVLTRPPPPPNTRRQPENFSLRLPPYEQCFFYFFVFLPPSRVDCFLCSSSFVDTRAQTDRHRQTVNKKVQVLDSMRFTFNSYNLLCSRLLSSVLCVFSFSLSLCFSFTVRKDLELRLQFRFFNNLHRKSTRIQ